ncbi:MAG: PVC-type heme-binding CxxCH protein [Pirellula sp.]
MNRTNPALFFAIVLVSFCPISVLTLPIAADAQDFIPRKQTKPPGPPLSPNEAISRMTVPEGFHVELVANEPDLQNPVAMAFDDAGRIYVTESFEYPRHEPGPGKDRIKILSDTDGDGKVDRVKVFAEGLNIPSGIAVGHGGVWVANAPDILFLQDTDGDDVADKSTVVVTGFGRIDTHELPNALTWGPDGYLYGLNGVFNPSVVEQDGKRHEFTCAMFRIHPRTKKFEIFCEGTSNPWGIAFDPVGSAFVSACVIDHLWHLTESGYYLRQGGPYPPHTWWAESIVKHKHQMAAYCGIEYFDSDAYPEAYRDKLYMGNIHGGCINVDRIERTGGTYQGFGEPDFLTANDVWFMPVAQKIGPDGCLYVLDWYDRYHCYQDASADPKGVDRGHGRLYRIVHSKRPEIRHKDISKLSELELISALSDPNLFVRQRSQLEISERGLTKDSAGAIELQKLVLETTSAKSQMHAIWALAGSGALSEAFLDRLLSHSNSEVRAWAVRLTADQYPKNETLVSACRKLAKDPDARVRVQVAIAAPKFHRALNDEAAWVATELDVLDASSEDLSKDPLLGRIVWQNLKPVSEAATEPILASLKRSGANTKTLLHALLPRFAALWTDRLPKSDFKQADRKAVEDLFSLREILRKNDPSLASTMVEPLIHRALNRGFDTAELKQVIRKFYAPPIDTAWDEFKPTDAWDKQQLLLGLLVGDTQAIAVAKVHVADPIQPPAVRQDLLRFLAQESPQTARTMLTQVLELESKGVAQDRAWRDTAIDLGIEKYEDSDRYALEGLVPKLPVPLQVSIAERMCQREPTASVLLSWIAGGKLRKELLSPNRIRLLATQGSSSAKELTAKVFGTVNVEGTQEREQVVQRVSEQLKGRTRGDAHRGWAVYERICGQCHVMHSRGIEVGPNITANGRGSFEQLLVSIFNPSLVIGDAYRSVTVRTTDGTIITGLLVSRDDRKTVIKTQGGKVVSVAAEEIDAYQQDKKSLMPEGIENQLSPQELADLMALLSLERAPEERDNRIISGTPEKLHNQK